MILVTGGLGFIGPHTARALLDLGEDVVVTRFRTARVPDFLTEEQGKRLYIEQADVADADALAAIGRKYPIDGIVHLATPRLSAQELARDVQTNVTGLLNLVRAAADWGVRRLSLASSLSVYAGVAERPWREDMPLPIPSGHPITAFKKAEEILGGHFADRLGVSLIHMRIAGIYGPLYHSMSNPASRLVHAAVGGKPVEGAPIRAGDGTDMCYVKDCARGIALLQTAPELPYDTFNVASGTATTCQDLADAIRTVIPSANLTLEPSDAAPGGPQDLTRIREAVGYEPEYDVNRAVEDYIAWLRAGHEY